MAKEKLTIIIDGDSKGAVRATKTAEGSISKLGKVIGGLAIGGGALFAAKKGFDVLSGAVKNLTGFVKGSISTAADFEKAMRNVNSIMGLSEQEFSKTSEAVTKMAAEFPQSSQVLAEGLYDIASSGFQGAEGLKVLEASARAASAGLTDTKTAATGITAVLNAYGLEAEDAAEVSDVMFTTVKKGVTTFEKLSSNLGTILSTAKTANISFKQVSGALAYMTTKGIGTEEAVTSLNRVVLNIIDPTAEMTDVLKDAGYETGELALAEEGLIGVLELVEEAAGGSITKLQEMFADSRSLKGAAALLGGGFQDLEKFMGDFNNTAGATSQAFEEQSKSYAFQLDILKTRFGDVKKTIGDAFLPVLTETIGKITESGGMFDDFAGGIEKIAGRIGEIINTIATGEEYADLTFGEKILAVWDNEILPGIQTKIDEIWAKFGAWIENNQDTISSWGESIGEILSRAITAVLGTASLDIESEESLSNAEEFGKAFGAGIVKGVKEVFTLKNIWELIMGQLGFQDKPAGGLENSIEDQTRIFEEPFGITFEDNTGEVLDNIEGVKTEIDTNLTPKEGEVLIGDNTEDVLGWLGELNNYQIGDKTFNVLPLYDNTNINLPYWMNQDRQSGGELFQNQYVPDLEVHGIKGEGYIPEPLMRAIKQGKSSYAGVGSGGGGGGDIFIEVTGPISIREESDITRTAQGIGKEISYELARDKRGKGY